MSTNGKSNKGKESSDSMDIEDLLIHAQLGVRLLKKGIKNLEQENSRLRDESQPQYSGSTTDDDNLEELSNHVFGMEVEGLKQRVSKLEKENSRLRKQNKDLLKSSLSEEVDELLTGKASCEEVDPLYRMRKLLRRFSDLMVVSTIAEDDGDCPTCLDPFKVKETSALVCGHLICHACLPGISRASSRDTEALRCPMCRQDTPREQVELVHMTETDRWDRLTEVAQAWMAFDRRGELESSEEDDEEKFITDGNGTSEATSNAENNDDETIGDATNQEQEPEGSEQLQASPLPSTSRLSFSDSPSKLKRKRMEELVAERSQRRKET